LLYPSISVKEQIPYIYWLVLYFQVAFRVKVLIPQLRKILSDKMHHNWMREALLYIIISTQKYRFYSFLSLCIAKIHWDCWLTKNVVIENPLWEKEINGIVTFLLQICTRNELFGELYVIMFVVLQINYDHNYMWSCKLSVLFCWRCNHMKYYHSTILNTATLHDALHITTRYYNTN